MTILRIEVQCLASSFMYRRSAAFLLVLLLCLVLLVSACDNIHRNTTFSFGGALYRWVRSDADQQVFSTIDGLKTISLSRLGNSSAYRVIVVDRAYVVNAFVASNGSRTIHALSPDGSEMYKIVDAKGAILSREGSEQEQALLHLFGLIVPHDDVAHQARPRPLESLALGALFATYGVFQLLFPERAWQLSNWLMFKKAELSGLHIGILQLTGLIFALLGLGLVAHAARTYFGH